MRGLSYVNFFYITRKLFPLAKLSIALILTSVLFTFHGQVVYISIYMLFYYSLVNFMMGYVLAFMLSIPFYLLEMNGKLMDVIRGESIGEALTQRSFFNKSSSLYNFIIISFLTYFICCNGLLLMIKLLFTSFNLVQVYDFVSITNLLTTIINIFKQLFVWFALISAPGILISIIVDVTFSFSAVAVPSLNVFSTAFPLKSLFIIFLYILFLPLLFDNIIRYFAYIILII